MTRIGKVLLTLLSFGLPLLLLATSWVADRWPVLLFDTLSLATAGVILISYTVKPFKVQIHWSLAAPLSAAAIGALQLQTNTTVNPNATLLAVFDWIGIAAFYFVIQQFFALSPRLSRYFPGAALTFSTLYAVYAIVQWFTSNGHIFWHYPNDAGVERVLGTILNRNHYSAFIELFLPAVFWYFLESPRRNPHAAIATGVLFASIVASTSRGGFAVAILELIVVFLLRRYWDAQMPGARNREGRESSGWLIAAAGVALVVFTAAIGIGPLQERLLGPRAGEFLADYGQSRWEYAEASVQMIKARPRLGFGLNTWPEIYPAYGTYDSPDTHVNHAHNDPIEWLAEGGLVFLIPLILLVGVCVRTGFRQPWAFGPVGVLIHSLVDFPLQKPAIVSSAFVILAAGIARSRRD